MNPPTIRLNNPAAPPTPPPTMLQCRCDEGFAAWLQESGGSVAVSTYQAGMVVMVGWDGKLNGGAGGVSILPRRFDKPMGMAVQCDGAGRAERIALATRRSLALLADSRLLAYEYQPGDIARFDGLFLMRVSWHTNDIFPHDLAFASDGQIWVVNTRFSCLATPSERHAFEPRWRPTFISDLVPEDRCHLNGLAMVEGRPRYVTALGETDTAGGWRPTKNGGGVVIDVRTGETVSRGYSMPHSPRWHDGRLELLNSGTGEYGFMDTDTGRFEPIAALPGYLRGLCAVGPHALVGMCMIREKHIFGGLPVSQRWPALKSGVAVVDRTTGRVLGELEFTSGCQEVFEVRFLPGVRHANILNLERPEAADAFPLPAPYGSYWLRPDKMIADDPLAQRNQQLDTFADRDGDPGR
ncbi:hypothetical protein Isop_0878 [Isosphaera pallida ATCC 43644]|uniref:Conserved hypothetical protein CHP03032 domain-containing protein n=1 Tax=Isosphaera pallida (strain ATCC 43644 / DSM 9630 / IS1B) TaxID=575540 RepID=E8R2W4_ISOPI|nr:TIGR03032 family protein [Isosphaera pallida]ADV61468.1 hypothetical protein Isop_0878 [Isosphaera pallida ATCC 43644]